MGNNQEKLLQQIDLLKEQIRNLEQQMSKDPTQQYKIESEILKKEDVLKRIQKQTWHSEDTRLDQVIGLENVRIILKAACVLPSLQPQIFKANGGPIEPSKKILLYGPPGTGKTLLAESAAFDAKAEFFPITLSELGSSHYYETDNRLRKRFMDAASKKFSIIFIDEIDSLGRKRGDDEQDFVRSVKNTMLQLIDKLPSNVILMACTNYLSQLDTALLRRFDLHVYVRLPDADTRKSLLKLFLSKPIQLSENELIEVSNQLDLFSGADIQNLVRKAEQANLEQWMHNNSWKQDPSNENKFIPCDPNDKAVLESSIIKLPANMLSNPPPVCKRHLLGALSYVKPTSSLDEVLLGAPDYIKEIFRQKVQEEEKEKKKEKGKKSPEERMRVLSDIARVIISQPPETISALTQYVQAVFPAGLSENIIDKFL